MSVQTAGYLGSAPAIKTRSPFHRFCARARKEGSPALRFRWQRVLAKGRRVKGCGIMREEVGLPSVVAWAGCFRRRRRIRRRYAP